jgi:hypothetical protein
VSPAAVPDDACMVALVLLLPLAAVAWYASRHGRTRTEVAGVATILAVTDAGMTMGDRPLVRLGLRVEVAGLAPYDTEASALVPPGGRAFLVPGARVGVRVDPQSPTTVAVDLSRLAVTPAMAAAERRCRRRRR